MRNNYLELFLEMLLTERTESQNTIDAYTRDLNLFLNYTKKCNINLPECTTTFMHEYVASLSCYSRKTILRKISTLKQFFKFLDSEKFITSNPMLFIDAPRTEMSLPKVLNVEQIENLLNTAKQDQSTEGVRLSTLLELLYASGLRVSELLSLKLSDIQFSYNASTNEGQQSILIKGKGNKERLIIINESAINTINLYLNIRNKLLPKSSSVANNWLFPSGTHSGHLTRQRLGQLMKQLAIKANINPELVSPHVFRHSFASHILEKGADLRLIQELLGHANISSTQIYVHLQSNKLKATVEQCHPLVTKPVKTVL